ncbi:kinase-like domain-containing protein [Cokeromyces recurvatus]|uniref:kinase-like domain-containing protein n=1 Tax=Cokeromyces recurvatus TaxID=90255 RepID=UPI00221F31DD|nr:kinase-like domain-containing protein [Cokeromyces recurvatus]KAI7906449.1 kinase-like domain-containing protein [Cokeromyces recurvatus]
MQTVNGVPVFITNPHLEYFGLDEEPTWFSAQGGVYKCVNRVSKENVAIKKYLVEENIHEDMFVMPKELVENEIYSMTKCVHPNILKLLAVHLYEEFVYLIMPLCTGGSLQQYTFEHQVTIGQLVYIIKSIASGLAKIHSYGYIHRDIKCDNIFLNQEDNSIVIGDFGVVSISSVADSSVEEAGVVLFWSPELVQQKIVNYKIDIWALGIVILEILNGGSAPYEDEGLDEEEIKQRILDNGRPEYPSNIPASLADLLDHCLDPDPHTRLTANYVLEHPFLQEYEPELLFPAAQFNYDVSSQPESDLQSIMHDDTTLNYKFDSSIEMRNRSSSPTINTKTTTYSNKMHAVQSPFSSRNIKCRLPLPSFTMDKSLVAATPVREKIINVICRRQSMTDASRNQGSRIPVLSTLHPLLEELIVEYKKEKIETSRLSMQRKANPINARKINQGEKTRLSTNNNNNSNENMKSKNMTKPKGQLKLPSTNMITNVEKIPIKYADIKTNIPKPKIVTNISLKNTMYQKRLPISNNESRTARLSMGLSANGARKLFKSKAEQESNSSSLEHRAEKMIRANMIKESVSSIHLSKKRPVSFTSFSASNKHYSDLRVSSIRTIPHYTSSSLKMIVEDSKSKRQSVPASSKISNKNQKHSNKKPSNNSKDSDHSLKNNNIKALRVH